METLFWVRGELVHRDPDLVLWHGVLTPAECAHLRTIATPYLGRSATFGGADDPRRTSESAFALGAGRDQFFSDPVLQTLMLRCATLCGQPKSHVEPPQVVRYLPGQLYVPHNDNYVAGNGSLALSGQRDYTFFLYLNEPPAEGMGGGTDFPTLPYCQQPETGAALFWRNVNTATGEDDMRLLHAGLPPRDWTKWGVNVWVRHRPWIG